MQRKITEEMMAWKKSSNKKALIVKGLRQVGKTTSVRAFAEENYENIVSYGIHVNTYVAIMATFLFLFQLYL